MAYRKTSGKAIPSPPFVMGFFPSIAASPILQCSQHRLT